MAVNWQRLVADEGGFPGCAGDLRGEGVVSRLFASRRSAASAAITPGRRRFRHWTAFTSPDGVVQSSLISPTLGEDACMR